MKIEILIMLVALLVRHVYVQSNHEQETDRIYVNAVAWSYDDSKIAAVGINPTTDEGHIFIFDGNIGRTLYHSETPYGGYASVAWSLDSRYIAVGGYDQTIKIIDVKAGEVIATLVGHRGVVTSVDWNSAGTQLVSSSPVDQQVILWDTTTYMQTRRLEIADPWSVAFSPNDESLAVGGSAGLFVFPSSLDIDNNQDRKAYQYSDQYVGALAWSHDGSQLSFGTQGFHSVVSGQTFNPQVYVVNSGNRNLVNSFEIQQGEKIFSIAWSPNDDQVATYSTDGFVRIWEVRSGKLLDTFSGSKDYVETGLSFSPYGGRLAYGGSTISDVSSLSELQTNTANATDAIVQIVVPAPSLDRLQAIAKSCGLPNATEQSLPAQITTDSLNNFTAAIQSLPTGTIPVACAADLVAVAQALQAQ